MNKTMMYEIIGAALILVVIWLAEPQGQIQIFGKEFQISVHSVGQDKNDGYSSRYYGDYEYEYDYNYNTLALLTEQDTNKEVNE